MDEAVHEVRELLCEVARIHHQVYRITDGTDPDWPSWYADWLVDLSELPDLLGRRPGRSELVYHLVALDREYSARAPSLPWEEFYAGRLVSAFA